jgi:hypothetical protein
MLHRFVVTCVFTLCLIVPATASAMSAPVVTGTYAPGQTLSCSGGDISQVGFIPVTISRRWFWGMDEMGTGDTYVVKPEDVGHQVYCELIGTDAHGITSGVLSEPFPLDFFTDPGAPAAPPCTSSTPSEATLSDPLHDTVGPGPVADLSAVKVSLDAACALTFSLDFANRRNPEGVSFQIDLDGDRATGNDQGYDAWLNMTNWVHEPPSAKISHWLPARHQWDNDQTQYPVQAWSVDNVSLTLPVNVVGVIPGATAHLFAENSGAQGYDTAPEYGQPGFPFTIAYSSAPIAPAPQAVQPAPAPNVLARPQAPVLVKAPALSGKGRVGTRLKCSPGRWTGAAKLAYAWSRDGKRIKGVTRSAYTVRRADRGHRIGCTVSATNAGGTKAVAARAVKIRR